MFGGATAAGRNLPDVCVAHRDGRERRGIDRSLRQLPAARQHRTTHTPAVFQFTSFRWDAKR